MKSLVRLTLCLGLFASLVFPARAAFTSLYIFGDGTSTTTNGTGASYYYNVAGKRYCNGRVWVEVLAQRQGLISDTNKNWSYFGHDSPSLLVNITNFPAPPDANTALFVVWINNADFVYDVQNYSPYNTGNLTTWTNAINLSLANHRRAVTNLYAKGARTLIMPNAVDIMKTPNYPGLNGAEKGFIRQRVIDFNSAFAASLSNLMTALPGLKIYVPDFFTLVDDALAHPANYGFTNATVSAIDAGYTVLNGPGTNYFFWDYLHPTAKFQMELADFTQQLISPARINDIIPLIGSNRLDLANTPVGRNGFVDGSTNFLTWTTATSFASTNATQPVFVPAVGSQQFYRLRFPFAWTWP